MNQGMVVIAFAAGWVLGSAGFMVGFLMGRGDFLRSSALENISTIRIPIAEIDRGAIVIGRANEPRVLQEKRSSKERSRK